MAMEEAKDDKVAIYERQKSVDALVHGAVLMRAISREEDIDLDYDALVPNFGFPVLSSDRRPYHTKKPKSSPHTDVTFMTVDAAVSAYKKFFANKEARSTPFLPKVDANAGCGVVKLSGTTLHLYETAIKDGIEEEAVRPVFAEAMLGLLHVLQQKVLPRVNTVHYHILVTSLPPPSGSNNGSTLQPTTFVSVDLTGPFTSSERARLVALGEPLGLSKEQVTDFTCIEDIVMEIQDATGVSVVHDLLQDRDDLEALLTPTLVELLPEDGVLDDADEDETNDEYNVATVGETKANRKKSKTRKEKNPVDVNDDNDDLDVDGGEDDAPEAIACRKSSKHASTAAANEEDYTDYDVERKTTQSTTVPKASLSPASSSSKAAGGRHSALTATKTSPPAATLYKDYHDDEEEELYRRLLQEESEEGNAAATTRKVLDEDSEEVEVMDDADNDDQEEEDNTPSHVAAAAASRSSATSKGKNNADGFRAGRSSSRNAEDNTSDVDEPQHSRRSSSSRHVTAPRRTPPPAPPRAVREQQRTTDSYEAEDDDEEMEVVTAPVVPRGAPGRRGGVDSAESVFPVTAAKRTSQKGRRGATASRASSRAQKNKTTGSESRRGRRTEDLETLLQAVGSRTSRSRRSAAATNKELSAAAAVGNKSKRSKAASVSSSSAKSKKTVISSRPTKKTSPPASSKKKKPMPVKGRGKK